MRGANFFSAGVFFLKFGHTKDEEQRSDDWNPPE
jgi:hypothetical protein